MIDHTLREYVEKQRRLGATDEQIKNSLEANSWKPEDVTAALHGTTPTSTGAPVILPSGRDILRTALHEYGERFWFFLELVLLPVLVVAILVSLSFAISLASALLFNNALSVFILILTSLLFFAAAMYVMVWSQVALLVALRDGHENIRLREAFRRAKPLITVYFSTVALNVIVIIGGLLFFVIPGILFAVWFSFVSYLVVADGQSGGSALMRSRECVAGRFWEIVWRFLFIIFVLALASTIAQVLLSGAAAALAWSDPVVAVLNGFFQFAIAPITVIYGYRLFEAAFALPPARGVRPSEKVKNLILGVAMAGYLLAIFLLAIAFFVNR